MLEVIYSICSECNSPVESLWPVGNGVCDECLVKNYKKEEVINATCGCLHKKIKEIFKKRK